MMMTNEWLDIIEQSDELADMILTSDVLSDYRSAHRAVYGDAELVRKIREFSELKERYEEVQRFGRYHPDYNRVMKTIRLDKRALDMNEKVAALRLAENDVQYLLDEISATVARAVSESVKLPSDNTFVTEESCGGGCGSGGGCSCSA
ncbi:MULTISPECIES: YlbF family regulator [Sporosarcina]|uniref:YlbF family regulator n=1 Tax=Sporosarcina TaxID=1569 RepID=UPI00058DD971|nr:MULTISPECIES: YlbF family regulator [Sporosarcina]WJY28837.1 YlbF family regulator [Sporosarcina sp. 0.2-SM1T-5]